MSLTDEPRCGRPSLTDERDTMKKVDRNEVIQEVEGWFTMKSGDFYSDRQLKFKKQSEKCLTLVSDCRKDSKAN